MQEYTQFYIDGKWVDPVSSTACEVVNPATEEAYATIPLGSSADVDVAVAAAKKAFESFSQTSREERIALLEKVIAEYANRMDDMAVAIMQEMGAPINLAKTAQAPSGIGHLMTALEVLKEYEFESELGGAQIFKEPIGVCGLITPWNWPINQVACKVAPALATGCTMVLKPSEVAPISSIIWAEIMDAAGVPAGVFNLIMGEGPIVGEAMSAHPDIDMMSFTGSTRGGIAVAKGAADTVKRVSQELGGKSANIILDDADLEKAVGNGVAHCMMNTGQSCNAPTRMLVPRAQHDEAVAIAVAAASSIAIGNPTSTDTDMGPVVNAAQFSKIQGLIQTAIDEGTTLACGGTGRPEGIAKGFYIKPTIFANVTNDMTIAREEVFGPVLAILPYDSDEEAVKIANDTVYGLAGYVSGSTARAQNVAKKIRAGMVQINSASFPGEAPFGGYKQSGNGREWGEHGFEEFLETKAIAGN
ncbi:MAG: aldehyde dehydrogenase (NAD+) [Chitinophagales bacterium]|jgi:aldehyde dehydrogenase (NAD+)